jgi:hypothetical protein
MEKFSIPTVVSSEGDVLDNFSTFKIVYQDIIDKKKLPERAREKHFCTKSMSGTCDIVLEMQVWEIGLKKSGILNLLEVPHFRCSLRINDCVKLLLSCIHGGTL